MPYSYSKKQARLSLLVEGLAAFFLFPLVLFQKPSKRVKKILLIEPFQMGDVLSLTPMIQPLLELYAQAEIFVLTKPGSGSILEFDTRIKEVIKFDFPWSDYGYKQNQIIRWIRVLRKTIQLRKYQFDVGIDTRGDIRSQILMLLAGCKERVGYQNYLHSNITIKGYLLTQKIKQSVHLHRYESNMELLTTLGLAREKLYPIAFPCFFPDKLIMGSSKQAKILVHIGGGWEYKRWSEKNWVKLINKLTEKYNQISVIAGPGEKQIIERIEAALKISGVSERVTCKVTSLQEMITLILGCQLFIGLDSGPMNLAVCLNKNTIALFGPGDSKMWRPLNNGGKFIQKVDNYPCSPCLQTTCLFPKKNCMQEIDVEDVYLQINN